MGIYAAIGLAWVIFTSAFGSIAIIYLAYVSLRSIITKQADAGTVDVPLVVKEMFKIAR